MAGDEAQDRTNEPYLAAEIIDGKVAMSIPKDSLTAKYLLEHLRHKIEVDEMEQAAKVREQIKKIRSQGVSIESPAALNGIGDRAKHLRS